MYNGTASPTLVEKDCWSVYEYTPCQLMLLRPVQTKPTSSNIVGPTMLDQQCWTMLALSVQTASTKIQNANNYVTMSINKMAAVFKFKVQK